MSDQAANDLLSRCGRALTFSRGDVDKCHVVSVAPFRITAYRYQKNKSPRSLKESVELRFEPSESFTKVSRTGLWRRRPNRVHPDTAEDDRWYRGLEGRRIRAHAGVTPIARNASRQTPRPLMPDNPAHAGIPIRAVESDQVLRQDEPKVVILLRNERSCRRPVTNFNESRPPPVSSCSGRTRYCGCLRGIAAKRGGTREGHRTDAAALARTLRVLSAEGSLSLVMARGATRPHRVCCDWVIRIN